MADMNYERILQTFFVFNLEIQKSFYKQTTFLDKNVETEYRQERYKNSTKKKIYSDAFIIFSYLAILIYIYVHDYGKVFAYVCIGCLGVALILIAITYLIKNYSFDLVINHLLVFLISIFLNWKVMYIACYLNTPENDNDAEIIRTVIYDFVSANILAYITLDARLSVSASLFLLNYAGTVVAQLHSNSNNYYYLDGMVNLPVTLFFYLFKKAWEESDRTTFADKYRFAKFYYYTRDFIKGSNGYYLNISKDFSVCCDSKMKTVLHDMHIDRTTGKSRGNDQILDVNDISEVNKNNEIKCLMTRKVSVSEENYGNLSAEVLDLFKLYDEIDWKNGNLNGTKESLMETIKVSMLKHPTIQFLNLGKFKLVSSVCTKYFDVYFRKFSLDENNSINDILMYDVTELITSRQTMYEEGIIKEKVMTKIINEFKTPINSIIGVIGNIEDSINSRNTQDKATMKHLETIRNLSNYVIFSISDIIHFTKIKSFDEIQIFPQRIELREIADFGYDILKSLLRCSKSKSEAIQPALEFDDQIDSLHIIADEIRLKQIMLNIISNAVKFTKSGSIRIKCSIITLKQFVLVSISDSGMGIPDNEQVKLFNGFQMFGAENVYNTMGNGLGLSICKSLATSMGVKISATSVYGVGTQFSLAIPFKCDSQINNSQINIFFEESNREINQGNKTQSQDMNAIHSDRLLASNFPNHFGMDSENKFSINESHIKYCESSRIKSNMNPLNAVRLGIDDYVNPNINFLSFSLIDDFASTIRNNSSRLDNNRSRIISQSSKSISVEIIEKKRIKILIVDDNCYNGEATKNILNKIFKESCSEIDVIICSDGVDILYQIIQDQSKGNEIKCIITDENMEYIKGSEAIRIIRNLERNRKIKFVNIISATGNDESQKMSEIIEAGAQLVLNKPVQEISLKRALEQLNIIK